MAYTKIEKPIKAVDNVVRHLNLSEEEREKLLIHFSEPTKYGLINAITNLAGQTKDVEEQVRLEEYQQIKGAALSLLSLNNNTKRKVVSLIDALKKIKYWLYSLMESGHEN